MTYNDVIRTYVDDLLPIITEKYGLEGYEITRIKAHVGGRNIAYNCEREDSEAKIIRIIYLKDRSLKDILGETEYIRYLFDNGGSVSNVISSVKGNLVEEIIVKGHTFYVSLFDKAKGIQLADNNYQYREGVPLSEYFYSCGKVLGKLHQLSKEYNPVHRRYTFFDKYNAEYINKLIPDSYALLKVKLKDHLKVLEELDQSPELFGMVHFDYSDGNFIIDYNTGDITVYDFDNSCFCWYMYELANLWVHGVGWVQFEPDVSKRKKFMEEYFETVLTGYRSETQIEDSMLDKLPLFIQVTLIEGIIDTFEVMLYQEEELKIDEELAYDIKCMEEDILFRGFFHDIYSCEEPFEYAEG
jgi:Ser/Thr protein kinase RdoA (MazF antagonist)